MKKIIFAMVLFFAVINNAYCQSDKVVIGVGEITSTVSNANPSNFQTMLETVLVQTNKFELVERSRLDQIMAERGLGAAGIADQISDYGGIQGVDYLIYGSITKLGETEKQTNFLIGGLNKKDASYEMAVDLRIVDVSNGRIVIAETVDVSSESEGSMTLGGVQGYGALGTSGEEGDPLGDVQRLGAVAVASEITFSIFPVKVAAVQSNGTIMLNYGDSVLTDDSFVRVFRQGEGFTDPDTGEVLGAEEYEVATLQVSEALSKFSKAEVVLGDAPNVGDVVRVVGEKDDIKAIEKEIKKAKKKKK